MRAPKSHFTNFNRSGESPGMHTHTPSITSRNTRRCPRHLYDRRSGVCSHCQAGLGRAVCHGKEQEPVTFTKYTGYTGRAGTGGGAGSWCVCVRRVLDSSSLPTAPRANQHIRTHNYLHFYHPHLATAHLARPERASLLNSIRHRVQTVTEALGGVRNRTHLVLGRTCPGIRRGSFLFGLGKGFLLTLKSSRDSQIPNSLYTCSSLRKTLQLPKPLNV